MLKSSAPLKSQGKLSHILLVMIAMAAIGALVFVSFYSEEEKLLALDGNKKISGDTHSATTLRVAIPSLREETFLGWNGSSGRKFYLDTLYEYLVYIDPDSGNLVPGLAESWAASKDGRKVSLQLRRGVHFNEDWGELRAQDVKYSIEQTISPGSRAGPASTLRENLVKVEVINSHHIEIFLKNPDIDFVRGYLTNGQQIPILSKTYIENVGEDKANKHPIGSGPYLLGSHSPGSRIVLHSNFGKVNGAPTKKKQEKLHWRLQPAFEKIMFFSVPSEATRVAMIKAGEVDIAPISYDSIEDIEKSGLQILTLNRNWAPVIRMGGIVETNKNLYNPNVPWSNKKVRQALNYAIDKNLIVEAIFHNHAESAGMDFPAKEFLDIPPYPYDPDKARQLLKEAGYPNGFSLKLNTFESSPGADLPLIAEVVAQFWQEIGVEARVIPVDWTSLRGSIVSGKANNVLWTHRGLAFSNSALGLQMSTSAKSIFATYSDSTTEKHLREIANELDSVRREQRIREMGMYLREQSAAIYLGFANEPFAVSRRIKRWPRISDHLTNFDQITLDKQYEKNSNDQH